jgi:hypothetical protein
MAAQTPCYSNILVFIVTPIEGTGYQQNIPITAGPRKATTVPALQFGKPIYQVPS